MCNIWKSRAEDALRPEHMRKLPVGLRTVNLSGGEPFLRADLPEFVHEVRRRCPRAKITISTNGYMPDHIWAAMDEILRIDPSVRLAVSIDGLGEAHDKIRGDEGAFENATSLIDRLASQGFEGLRLSMTLSASNLDQFIKVAELAASRGLELGVVAAHAARTHLGVTGLPAASQAMLAGLRKDFGGVISRWLRSWRPRQWLRAHFAVKTYAYLAGRPWRFHCRAGSDFFFLQADGTVYSCSVLGKPLGNLVEQDWYEIWRSAAAAEARRMVSACRESCWMICNARSIYRTRALRVIAWALGAKLLAHLRLFRLRRRAGRAGAQR